MINYSVPYSFSFWVTVFANIAIIFLVSFLYLKLLNPILQKDDKRSVQRAFWAGLVIRLLFAIVLYIVLREINFQQKDGFYYDDESFYHGVGTLLSSSFGVGDVSPVNTLTFYYGRHLGNVPFDYVVGTLYYIWGNYSLVVRLWMSFIGTCIIPLVYCFVSYAFNTTTLAKRAMWICVIYPTLILWSVAPLREIIVVFLGLLAILLAILPMRGWLRLLIWTPVVVVLTMFRTIDGVAIGTLSLITMLFSQTQTKKRNLALGIVTVVVLSVGIIWFTQTEAFASIMNESGDDLIQRYTNIAADTRGLQIANENTDTTVILRTLRVITLPNPFATIRDEFPASVFGFAEGLAWYILLPLVIIGYLNLLKSTSPSIILLFLLPIPLLVYSATDAGLTWEPLRARLIVIPILISLGAYGWDVYREHTRVILARLDFTLLIFYLSTAVLFILTIAVGMAQILSVSYSSLIVIAPIAIYLMIVVVLLVRQN